MYESGEYGVVVSGFAAVKDHGGKAVGVVGVDISLAHITSKVGLFGLQVFIIAVVADEVRNMAGKSAAAAKE
ncbi:MAG: hypothetical protein LBV27_02955, partial [Oscillospiraceae bacterium]|nr:hypothetical protein [Oscillospiraceae bacterium]